MIDAIGERGPEIIIRADSTAFGMSVRQFTAAFRKLTKAMGGPGMIDFCEWCGTAGLSGDYCCHCYGPRLEVSDD